MGNYLYKKSKKAKPLCEKAGAYTQGHGVSHCSTGKFNEQFLSSNEVL